jgi:hypothetical protein
LEESVKLLKSKNEQLEIDLNESLTSITSLEAQLEKYAGLLTE